MFRGFFRQAARIMASRPSASSPAQIFKPLLALAAVGLAASCNSESPSSSSCSASNPFMVDPTMCDASKALNVYAFRARDIDGNMVELGGDKYRGHVMIVVNVASE
jgi:hypothetical protein